MTPDPKCCARCGEKRQLLYAAADLALGGDYIAALCGDCIDSLQCRLNDLGDARWDKPPEGALSILTWKCKCHGWLYADPNCCLHTDASNLIAPEMSQSNDQGQGRRANEA